MAVVNIPSKSLSLKDPQEFTSYLAGIGIDYERWEATHPLAPDATEEEILTAYSPEIERLKASGGYVTADVINIMPTTPNLDVMLNKFNKEHWHDEDEVRFIVKGHALFHVAPANGGDIVSIEMEAGDLIRVPKGTMHWFNLCGDMTVRAIRLFQDMAGWTPHYTETGAHVDYQPLCFGTDYIPMNR
jgi:1,2-dihydroxy-3-keto-5-methylthiopentene dioxygenase